MNRTREFEEVANLIEIKDESSLYKLMKRGRKASITKDINEKCRTYLIRNEWNVSREAVMSIFEEIINHYFLQLLLTEHSPEKDDEEELEAFLKKTILLGLVNFKHQDASINQVYRYVWACRNAEEEFCRITPNWKVWQETSRIESLLNKKGK